MDEFKKLNRNIVVLCCLTAAVFFITGFLFGKAAMWQGRPSAPTGVVVVPSPAVEPCPEPVLTPCPQNYCIYNDIMGYKEIYWTMGAYKCFGIKRYDSPNVEMYTCK